jgi:hypothetical protein
MLQQFIHSLRLVSLPTWLMCCIVPAHADFFIDQSDRIAENSPRLSYGISVADLDNDGSHEFIVTGFGYPNLALSYKNGTLLNREIDKLFADKNRKTIGVAACDVDGDGFEEVYFLNTDSYSGDKVLADRLLDFQSIDMDLFEIQENRPVANLTAGRSVACVDRKGDGRYAIYVSNYGGPSRLYEVKQNIVTDIAIQLGMDRVTGGRAVVSGHILGDRNDLFAANERGPNFLYQNIDGDFLDRAVEYNIDDTLQNGRGTALADIMYNGRLGLIIGNWNGYHRLFASNRNNFQDLATPEFKEPSKIRTVISADFDNDGYDEIFFNNIGQPNRMFRLLDNGTLERVELSAALESEGLGTGAAVADIDGNGILDLLIAHGESAPQPLSLFTGNIVSAGRFVRIQPINLNGAPAHSATVTLNTNLRSHAKTIDAGSGYLCQMEPVAHYGLRKNEVINSVSVRWTDGTEKVMTIVEERKTHIVSQQK